METNNLQQSLLDAIDLISQKIADSSVAPLTIKAEIVEELDSGTHQYSISYGGTVYKDAYSTASMVYEPSTVVFVLIPDGDFDNPKIILNAVSPSAETYSEEITTENNVPISGNLIDIEIGQIDLKSWENKDPDKIIELNNIFATNLAYYLSTYKNFILSASIKTEIEEQYQKVGNYGLRLVIPVYYEDPTQDDDKYHTTKIFTIDTSNMEGNPYNFKVYQEQNILFSLDDSLVYDTTSKAETSPHLEFFVKDFGYDLSSMSEEQRQVLDNKAPDIHLKDFGLTIVNMLEEVDKVGHYLSIVSDNGTLFPKTEGVTPVDKHLSPILIVDGKKTSYKNYKCYWFVQDASIDNTNERFLSIGGVGWRCLNEQINKNIDEEGNRSFQYDTSSYVLTVKASDVISSLRYKCVLTKAANMDGKSDIIVYNEIEIRNLAYDITTSLYTKTGTTVFAENVGQAHIVARYEYIEYDMSNKNVTYSWKRYDKNGQYIEGDFFDGYIRYNDEISDNVFETEIAINTDKIDKLNIIECTFYENYTIKDSDGTNIVKQDIIGTNSITITTSPDIKFIVSIIGGDKLFKYDTNGNSPVTGVYDGPMSSQVTELEPLSFKVFQLDGTELNETEYQYCKFKWRLPINSMMTYTNISGAPEVDGYYEISGVGNSQVINYNIRSTFDKKRDNNDIYLDITLNEDSSTTVSSMKFVKEGESGTNGSKYTAYITYCCDDDNYFYNQHDSNGIMRKCQILYSSTEKKWKVYHPEYDILTDESERARKRLTDFDPNHSVKFDIVVYRDNQEILRDSTSSVLYKQVNWSMFDYLNSEPSFTASNENNKAKVIPMQVLKPGSKTEYEDIKWDEGETFCNILQAEIIVGNDGIQLNDSDGTHSAVKAQETIYAYYPIEIIRVNELKAGNLNKIMVPTMQGGYEQVLYSSFGLNPMWNNNIDNPFTCVDSVYEKAEKGMLDYDWSNSDNFVKKDVYKKEGEIQVLIPNQKNFTPITRFENGITKNYIQVKLHASKAQQDAAKAKRAEKVTTLENKTNEKTKYEDTVKKISEFITYYNALYKDTLVPQINNSKSLLNCRNILLDCLSQMLKLVEDNKDCPQVIKERYNAAKNQYDLVYKNINYDPLSNDFIVGVNVSSTGSSSNKAIMRRKAEEKYIKIWNNLVVKYNQEAQKYPASQQAVLESFRNNLRLILINNGKGIKELFPSDCGVPEFINLGNQLQAFIEGIDITTRSLVSYTAFEKMLQNINNLVSQSANYKINYQKKVNDCTEVITTLNNEIKAIDAYIADDDKNPELVLIKPIVMVRNKYEISGINNWDGNKIYVDKNNDKYIYAPQFGAGYKQNGLFTGMIMGIREYGQRSTTKGQWVGLFGYSEGEASMYLNAKDGSAIFGKSGGGQVIIDPRPINGKSRALIYSSNYFEKIGTDAWDEDGKPKIGVVESLAGKGAKGLLINLTDSYIHFGDEFGGKLYSGEHNELKNYSPGFYLSQDGLSIGSSIRIVSNTKDDNLGIIEVGNLKSAHWTIKGDSNNNYSYIGYNIENDQSGFETTQRTFYYHNRYGSYKEEHHDLKEIPYSYLSANNSAATESVYLGTNGLRLGKGSMINNKGEATFKGHVEATTGTIGSWSIINNALIGHGTMTKSEEQKLWKDEGYVVIDSKEGIYFSKEEDQWNSRWWKLRNDGSFYVDCPGSQFGGVQIEVETIESGKLYKCTHYESQKAINTKSRSAGVFQGTCHTEIEGIAKEVAPNAVKGMVVVNANGAFLGYVGEVPSDD